MNIDFTNVSATFLEDFLFETNFSVSFQVRSGIPTSTDMQFGHTAGSDTFTMDMKGTGLTDNVFGKLATGTITSLTFTTNSQLQAEITDINWSVADYLTALDAVESQRKFDPFIDFLSQEPITIRAFEAPQALLMETSDILSGPLKADLFVVGSDFGDRIVGGTMTNTVQAEGGDDTVYGNVGIDLIQGGKGNDSLYGGKGDDFIEGGKGNDRIEGGGNNDTMFGSAGKDQMFGGNGFDTISGGKGRDVIKGGKGNDEIIGGGARDRLFGGAGRDELQGGKGNDKLQGGAGRDLIIGDQGDDILTGGADADRFEFTKGCGKDVITDYQVGVDGLGITNALIDFKALTNAQIITEYLYVLDGNTVLDFGNGDSITLQGVFVLGNLANDITLF